METYFKNLTAEEGTSRKLVQDLKILIHDTEEFLKTSGGNLAGRSAEEALAALEKMKETYSKVDETARGLAKETDQFIQQKPYHAVGIAFGVGLFLGLILNRK